MEGKLDHWADFLVIVLYFIFVLAIGMWSLCRPNRSGVKGYFLAGRDMLWWPVGASLFASNIGSEHFVGLAGTGAASGIAVVLYEWSSMVLVLLLAWVFLPVYLSAGVYTLPEYLSRRFGGSRLRVYVSCLSLVLYIVTKIAVGMQVALVVDAGSTIILQSARLCRRFRLLGIWPEVRRRFMDLLREFPRVQRCARISAYPLTPKSHDQVTYVMERVSIYAGALFIQLSMGWNLYLSIVILLSVTCIYTVLGGLAAVIYTDTAQTAIMTVGAITLTVLSFNRIGGYDNLEERYMASYSTIRDVNTSSPTTGDVNSSCGAPPDDAFHVFRDPVTSDNPWPGLVLQSSLGCLWYWCADQVIVQRTLAARNLTHAKGGAILAGYLKLLPIFLMIFPGMISRALYPDEVGCSDPVQCEKVCGNPVGCSNIAYPKLVMTLLPVGLRGLLLAAMMSAIMSSLTSIFNSASTLFTMDLWRRVRPGANQRELLIVGRLCILGLCVVSILWVPLVQSSAGGQLFVYIQAVQGYLGTPLGALFLLAIFWKRMNEQGAFWGILAGHVCGIIRLVLDLTYPAPPCGDPDTRPAVVSKLHYTYFGQINLIFTAFVCVCVSLMTKPLDEEKIKGVTWWTRLRGSNDPEESTPEGEKEMEEKGMDREKKKKETTEGKEGCEDGMVGLVDGQNNIDAESQFTLEPSKDPHGPPQTFLRRWVKFLCGIPEAEVEVMDTVATRRRLLYEKPRWRTFVNMNAVLGLTVMAFLWGFYH